MSELETLVKLEQRLLEEVAEIRAAIGERAALGVEHAYNIARGYRIMAENDAARLRAKAAR